MGHARSVMPTRRTEPVHRITTAGHAPSEELTGRQTRYLISMGIRTACFLGAVMADGWLRWTLLLGAILLPYVSVVVANAGRERLDDTPVALFLRRRRALDGGTGPTDDHRTPPHA